MKAVIIKGIEMPDENGMLDVRIYGDGTVFVPCAMGEGGNFKAENIEIPEGKDNG